MTTNAIRHSDEIVAEALGPQWNYDEEVDPVTRTTKTKTVGRIYTNLSSGEPVVADLVWDCSDGTPDSLKLEITTFLNEKDAGSNHLKPLHQDENHAIDYRFDGVATSISSQQMFSGFVLQREYRNSVSLHLIPRASLWGRSRYPGLYSTSAGKEANQDNVYPTINFYVVDPEFAARIPTTGGANLLLQFSLAEPSIKRILTQCGVTFGNPPGKSTITKTTN